jgi:hypothetical protein
MEAMRCLRRRLSDAVYRQLAADSRCQETRAREGTPGRLGHPARPACPRTPALRISHFPDPHPRRYRHPGQRHSPWPPQPLPPGGAPEVTAWSVQPDERR